MTPLIEEVLNAIRTNPEVREAIRRELLTQELLELPERLAGRATETNRSFENLERGQEELRQSQERLERRLDDLAPVVSGIGEDLRPLKAGDARNAMMENALDITLVHGCLPTNELSKLDLYRMMRDNNHGDISRSEQVSFRNADLVVEARQEDTSEVHYFAIEASFTSGIGDIRRAVRNSAYITRFTGRPAHPVVACVNATPDAEAEFEAGECERYTIPRRLLEPE